MKREIPEIDDNGFSGALSMKRKIPEIDDNGFGSVEYEDRPIRAR